ncbi:hypothetical protein [Flavobacterium sp. MDT1-60]|uniref:hypothetical protein n=1 Tax=Flavobacterium sp. MDT1-60 TaxID=1979344 RepID=UPI00177A92B0|nr:hypothetical protein [Flavobacterium sp. MDT1-60]QOG01931.1 hypothetical protein IHE43_19335 [Flavobacterium sp. MDT1-60]
MSERELKSKNKKGYWVPYILGIAACLALSVYSYTKFIALKYPDYIGLIFSVLLLVIALLLFYFLISIKTYTVINNKLIVISFERAQKTYNLNEVKSWTEVPIKGKYDRYEVFILHFKSGEKIKLSSNTYDNYFELKNELTKNKERNLKLEELNQIKSVLIGCIVLTIIGILFLVGAYNKLQNKDLEDKDIIVFGDKTSGSIQYINRKHDFVLIKLESYPDFDFRIQGKDLKATFVEELINEIKTGDSIFLGIDKTEYRTKIIKTDSLSFSDQYFFNEVISVISVHSKKNDYLKLSEVNAIRSDDKYWDFVLFSVFGLLLTVPGIYGIKTAIIKMNNEQ